MSFLLVIVIGTLTILFSELMGRGKVLYTRLFMLSVILVLVSTGLLYYVSTKEPLSIEYAISIFISVIPILAAWFGLRVHLSNSITLNLLTLLENKTLSREKIEQIYDPVDHAGKRVEELRAGGYLSDDPNAGLTNDVKSRFVYKSIIFLRGSN